MMRFHYFFTLLLILLFKFQSRACSCIGESSVKEEIKQHAAVFVGTVIHSEEIRIIDTSYSMQQISRAEMKFWLVVETTYKGNELTDTVFVYTGTGGGDCGFDFKVGQQYIVYAENLREEDRFERSVTNSLKGIFYTTICTRTKPFNAQEILEIEKVVRKQKKKSARRNDIH